MPASVLPRRPGPRRVRGVVACALLAPVLAGCSGAVSIEDREVPDADAAACRALLDELPDTLAGAERRPVEPEDALGAAWGDPALVLDCGTSMPASFDEFSRCTVADGAQWFVPDDAAMEDLTADIRVWSLGYEPIVSVLVPGDYRQRSDVVLRELGRPVSDELELVKRCT